MGTIIGVGLFSLPYIASRAGIWMMLLYLLLLGGVTVFIGWIYGEVALRTEGLHRLPGYAERYLGPGSKWVAFATGGLGLCGALLAYLIVGGGFLFWLLEPFFGGSLFLYVLIFFGVGAYLVYRGVRSIAQTEFLSLIAFFIILIFVFRRALPLIDMRHLLHFDMAYLFLPYGAVLFSLAGTTVIPELKDMLIEQPARLKKVVLLGTIGAVLLYLLFIVTIVGVTGPATSEDAISGLRGLLNGNMISLMFAFGILTTFTSFLTLGITLKKMLWYDLKMPKHVSWALAMFTPLILYGIGFDSFISVISLTGGVFLGVDIILIILIYIQAKRKSDLLPPYSLNVPRIVLGLLVLLFLLGVAYELWYFAV